MYVTEAGTCVTCTTYTHIVTIDDYSWSFLHTMHRRPGRFRSTRTTAQMLIATATNVPAQCLPSHVCIVRTSIELSVSSHNTNDHVACMHIVALGSGAPWTPVYSYVLHCYTARPSVRSFHLTTTSSSYTLVFSPSR